MKRLLLDLNSYGGSDPLGMFPLFLQKTAVVLAPRLAVVFWQLLRLGSFPVCSRVVNVTPIPKGPPKEDIGIEQQLYEIVRGKNFALNCVSTLFGPPS